MALHTHNNLITLFKNIADAHRQLKGFGHGEISELEGDAEKRYPYMWVIPRTASPILNGSGEFQSIQHTFQVEVFDLAQKDKSNETEILSDCQLILLDVIKVLHNEAVDFEVVGSPILNPYTEKYGDDVTGWFTEITIEIPFDSNYCDVPIDAFGIPGTSMGISSSSGDGLTCSDLESCPVIQSIEDDILALQNASVGYVQNIINVGETVNVAAGEEYIVYGNLTIAGTLNNNGTVTIINGALILTGSGTFVNNGDLIQSDLATVTSVSDEVAARIAGDADLQNQIDNLPPSTLSGVLGTGNVTGPHDIIVSSDRAIYDESQNSYIYFGDQMGMLNPPPLEIYAATKLFMEALTTVDLKTTRQQITLDEDQNKILISSNGWVDIIQNNGLGNVSGIQFAGGDSYYTASGAIEITGVNVRLIASGEVDLATTTVVMNDDSSIRFGDSTSQTAIFGSNGLGYGEISMQARNTDGSSYMSVASVDYYTDSASANIYMYARRVDLVDSSNNTFISFNIDAYNNIAVFSNDKANGIEYGGDYSANYTNRTLVDKEYVDLAIAAATPSISLASVLATGNTSGANDILMSTSRSIKGELGIGEILFDQAGGYGLEIRQDAGVDSGNRIRIDGGFMEAKFDYGMSIFTNSGAFAAYSFGPSIMSFQVDGTNKFTYGIGPEWNFGKEMSIGERNARSGKLIFYGSTGSFTNSIAVKAPSVISTSYTLTLPSALGSGGFIKTNSSGTVTFDNTTYVSSVNGSTGVVVLTTTDITEGTNLYYTNTRADARIALQRNAVNGLAGLDGSGKIYSSQLPALAITDTFIVASQAAMLALSAAETGDIAIRSDLNKSFILSGTYSVLADWKELLTPTDNVLSVFGRTGVVVAQSGDYNTSQVTENTNLYFTNARAIASTLTGYTSGAGTISSSDSILTAIQKLNGNIGAIVSGVSSVNSLTGAVVLTTTNIAEGTNLYYTSARFNTAFSGKSTTDLVEGSNLYFTNARSIASPLAGYVSGAGVVSSTDSIIQAIQKINGNVTALTTSSVAEGSNLYFTTARVLATTLSGYASTTGTISATDTILQAIGKLNGNISARTLQQVATSGNTTSTDLEITDTTKGLILKSPNGSRWRVTIDNTGNLISTSI